MVVLSAAVCTKQGKTLVARQFINMPRTRIEGLLAAFGKLVADSADRQHTYIETDSVRYVFQSMETLYLLLITNKASNIVEDLETLRLISKVVPEYCGGGMISEDVVQKNAFDLIFAFDEVISLGYRENITIQQIRTNLEMDSHEETLHDMIEASKMQEAKEEAKKCAKAIKKEQRERAKSGISNSKMVGIGRTPYRPRRHFYPLMTAATRNGAPRWRFQQQRRRGPTASPDGKERQRSQACGKKKAKIPSCRK